MGKSKEDDTAYRPLAVYTEVLAKIKSEYVEEPDMQKVTRGALQGLVEYLDPLSSYLTEEQYKVYKESLEYPDGGSGLATGIVVYKRAGYAHVMAVLPGSPADKAGIRPFDLIEAVDGLSTRVMPPAYLQAMLSGALNTSVNIVVRPARQTDEPEEHTLLRSAVALPTVTHQMLPDGIGYIDLDVMDAEHTDQVAKAVQALESAGAQKLILDLRGNAVGDPAEGIRLANLFIPEGKLASTKGQRYQEKTFEADSKSALTAKPLAVITDRTTAGGAEVAAAAILDRHRGEVVGERSSGLAALQETIPFEDGAALVLSIAKYIRPNGEAIQDGGVTPSAALSAAELRRYRERTMGLDSEEGPATPEPPGAEGSDDEDPYLKKAIEVLKGEVLEQAA